MSPESPYLVSGALSLVAGARREGGWPKNGTAAVIATAIVVLMASYAGGTKAAPIVRALGIVLLLASAMATITAFRGSPRPARPVPAPPANSSLISA